MRSPLLFLILAGVAFGQISPVAPGQINQKIEPDAEKLYRRAATALQQLPAYEMDVETTLQKPHGESGLGFHILATVAVRQPDQILISGSTPFAGQTTVYSDGRTSLFWQETRPTSTRRSTPPYQRNSSSASPTLPRNPNRSSKPWFPQNSSATKRSISKATNSIAK